jgi:triacylglycerol lipase
VYRTPFPRSSKYVHYRLVPMDKKLEGAGSVVTLTRPRGYLGHGRDVFTINGAVPDGVNKGVPGTSSANMTFAAEPIRSVPVVLNEEHVTVRTFPLAHGHIVIAELHY